jgi:splicing factor 3B subunit 1
LHCCPGYVPIRTPARKLTATPTPLAGTPIGFFMQTEEVGGSAAAARLLDPQPKGSQQLPFMKPEDAQYFDKLLIDVDEDSLSPEELKERKIMKLLLKIKVSASYFLLVGFKLNLYLVS